MSRYPYDYTVFHPGAACRTCRLPKPARSKHCSVCKRCVARADHHCIFINNCVGARNTHYFLLLLLSTAVLTLYGAAVGLSLITAAMAARDPAFRLLPWRGTLDISDWLLLWSWGLRGPAGDNVGMGAVALLALLTTPLVWALLAYHLWLLYCGTTTNETLKWSDWQAEMRDGCAFARRLPPPGLEPPGWTRWPADAEQILVRTEDGNPPAPHLRIAGVGPWERVWRLKDVENLYDIGFRDNLVDVFLPGHVFRDPLTPVVEGGRNRKRRRIGRRRG